MLIEDEMCYEEICEEVDDPELVARVLKLVRNNEHKRLQTAPVLKISPVTFRLDRKMPIA